MSRGATFAAVHASIMEQYFGPTTSRSRSIKATEFKVNVAGLSAPPHARSFYGFSRAAWENAMSRIWHWCALLWDAWTAARWATRSAGISVTHRLRPVPSGPCPADLVCGQRGGRHGLCELRGSVRCILTAARSRCRPTARRISAATTSWTTPTVLFATAYEEFLCPT